MNIKWNQSGMPTTLVSRLGLRSEYAEFKSVLTDAQNQVMTPVDAENMARELVQSGGRDYVDMVRELSMSLAQTRQELEAANQRYARLTEALERRGISVEESLSMPQSAAEDAPTEGRLGEAPRATANAQDEWEEWNRRFQSLLA